MDVHGKGYLDAVVVVLWLGAPKADFAVATVLLRLGQFVFIFGLFRVDVTHDLIAKGEQALDIDVMFFFVCGCCHTVLERGKKCRFIYRSCFVRVVHVLMAGK